MYEIISDKARSMITIVFTDGFWDASVFERFRSESLAAAAALSCPPGAHVVLVDTRRAVIQSQEVIAKIQTFTTHAAAARIAFVATSALTRMQAKRLQTRKNVRVFSGIEDAQRWLFDRPDQRLVPHP